MPRSRLRPPVSYARFTAAGLPRSVFVGATALSATLSRNRAALVDRPARARSSSTSSAKAQLAEYACPSLR